MTDQTQFNSPEDNAWFLQHCAQVLIDNGYAVIHEDRIVKVGVERAISRTVVECMDPHFLKAHLANIEQHAADEMGRYMLDEELIARAPDFGRLDTDMQTYVYRWGACVILPREAT